MSDPRLAFLRSEGIDAVRHNSHEDLLPHLMGTSALLEGWGARRAVVDAGLFHSVYGTEYFQTESLDATRRDAVRAVIGDEAEALVWLWCFGRRLTLEGNLGRGDGFTIQERLEGTWVPIDARQYGDLVDLWVADTLEQFDRVRHREEPYAKILTAFRDRMLPAAREALEAKLATLG
jgi:hypothetical protein